MGARKPNVFVLTSPGADADARYREAILPACVAASVECRRADDLALHGQLPQEIQAELEKASIVVADLTHRNVNVFYELGYAHALRRPTVLLAEAYKDVPFDLTSQRIIVYESDLTTLRTKLRDTLTTLLPSPVAPNSPQASDSFSSARVLTIVCGDIVRSSAMVRDLGELDASDALLGFSRRVQDIFREATGAFYFQASGDGFFAAFETTDDAILFALRLRDIGADVKWVATQPLLLRLAVHRGSVNVRPTRHGTNIVGKPMNIAALLCNAAKPDEIVLSQTAMADLSPDLVKSATRTMFVELNRGEPRMQATVVKAYGKA